MPRRTPDALVKAPLLVWARESIGLDIEEAAARAGLDIDKLAAWEAGTTRPTLAQLRGLADVYKRPLAVFYLPEPPRDFDAMKYYRRPAGAAERPPSPELAFQIRQAESRREIAIDLADANEVEPIRFTARATPQNDAAQWAAKVRGELGVTIAEQLAWTDEYDALAAWRSAVERSGILIFQISGIEIDEMRGFSIFAEHFPVIAINSRDAPRARVFSAMHELAHVVLGRSELDNAARFWISRDRVEVFCNDFAGQLLVPEDALAVQTSLRRGALADDVSRAELAHLTARFKVSEQVVLIRLLRSRRISAAFYEKRRAALLNVPPPAKTKGGPLYHQRVVANLGRPFIRSVFEAMHRDRITLSDVSDYLGVKVDHLSRIQEAVRLPYAADHL